MICLYYYIILSCETKMKKFNYNKVGPSHEFDIAFMLNGTKNRNELMRFIENDNVIPCEYYEKKIQFKDKKQIEMVEKILSTDVKETISEERKNVIKSREYWCGLHDELMKYLEKYFPGTFLIVVAGIECVIDIISINEIQIPNDNYIVSMGSNTCDVNTNINYMKNSSLCIYSGIALSSDGLWRAHKWNVDKNGNIIETSVKRLIYIGYNSTNRQKLFNQFLNGNSKQLEQEVLKLAANNNKKEHIHNKNCNNCECKTI